MNIKNKIFASYMVVFLMIIFMIVYPSMSFNKKKTQENYFFCGTEDVFKGDKKAREGGKLFNTLCASCHKLNKKSVGPALSGLKMDSILLYKYLNSKKHKPVFTQLKTNQISDVLRYLD